MTDFDKAFSFVLREEGGLTLKKLKGEKDYTYAGIYRYYHPDWEGWYLIDKGIRDTERLLPVVEKFYKENFWDKIWGDKLLYPLNLVLFDTAVNMHYKRAVKIAQYVLNKFFGYSLKVDGIMGKRTHRALSVISKDREEMYRFIDLYLRRRLYLYSIMNKEKNIYKQGWINRVIDLYFYIGACSYGR